MNKVAITGTNITYVLLNSNDSEEFDDETASGSGLGMKIISNIVIKYLKS